MVGWCGSKGAVYLVNLIYVGDTSFFLVFDMKKCFAQVPKANYDGDIQLFLDYVKSVVDSILLIRKNNYEESVVSGTVSVDNGLVYILCGEGEKISHVVTELNESNDNFTWISLDELMYDYLKSKEAEPDYSDEDEITVLLEDEEG